MWESFVFLFHSIWIVTRRCLCNTKLKGYPTEITVARSDVLKSLKSQKGNPRSEQSGEVSSSCGLKSPVTLPLSNPGKHSPDSTPDRNSSKQSWIISLEIMKKYDFSKLCSNGARSPNTWPWATENIFTWIFQVNILSHEPEFFRFMRQLLKLSSNARIISSFDFKHRTSYNTSLIRKYILGRPAGWSAGVGFLIYSKKAKRKCCWIRCALIFKGSSTWIHL